MGSSGRLDGVSVLLCTDYFPPNGGGVEVVVEQLALSLAEAGAETTVVALRTDETPAQSYDQFDVRYVDAFDLTSVLGVQARVSLRFPLALRKIVADLEPDLVHLHNRFFFTSLLTVLTRPVSRTLGDSRVVTTIHLGEIDNLEGVGAVLARLYERTLARTIIRSSDRLVAVSESVAETVLEPGDHPHAVVPNATDPDALRPGDSSDPKTVLFVGRLVENKGPRDLLAVAPDVIEEHPDVQFRFIGTGPLAGELKAKAREIGVQDNVEFLGHVDDVAAYMARADVFCRPSYSEGLPLTLLEAMAAGLPPVVSDVAGVGDVVEEDETGLLLEPGDRARLADHLGRLLSDDELFEGMSRRVREVVLEEYTWERRGEAIVDQYVSLLSRT